MIHGMFVSDNTKRHTEEGRSRCKETLLFCFTLSAGKNNSLILAKKVLCFTTDKQPFSRKSNLKHWESNLELNLYACKRSNAI